MSMPMADGFGFNTRLRANTVQEKLANLWLDMLIKRRS
jgi:hypothetical protein